MFIYFLTTIWYASVIYTFLKSLIQYFDVQHFAVQWFVRSSFVGIINLNLCSLNHFVSRYASEHFKFPTFQKCHVQSFEVIFQELKTCLGI